MATEKQLMDKRFYETLLKEHSSKHPVQELGEALQKEQKKLVYDLSYIRYAQGEVYFHYQDYETAIFKWESIENELSSWAKKNIGDAYTEVGLFSSAEQTYKSIETDSNVLKAEIAVKLFFLYLKQDETEKAYEAIQEALTVDPDHRDASSLAVEFYEKQQNWNDAVQLSIHEAIRTESPDWFGRVIDYAEQGLAKAKEPDEFFKLLTVLYRKDLHLFQKLAASLWKNYIYSKQFLTWLKTANNLFLNIKVGELENWDEIVRLFAESHNELLSGAYLLKDLQEIMPIFLTNWLKLSMGREPVPAAACVAAWSEIFRSSLDERVIIQAEQILQNHQNRPTNVQIVKRLFGTLTEWADKQQINIGQKYRWIMEKLAGEHHLYLLVVGCNAQGNNLIDEFLLGSVPSMPLSKPIFYQYGATTKVRIFANEFFSEWNGVEELQTGAEAEEAVIEIDVPNDLLKEHKLSLVEIPDLHAIDDQEWMEYVHLADGVVYFHSQESPLTPEANQKLAAIVEKMDDVSVHFVLETGGLSYENARKQINDLYPKADIHLVSQPGAKELLLNIGRSIVQDERKRSEKLLFFLKKSITFTYNKRAELESHLEESIKKNEDIVKRLNGLINSLDDLAAEKSAELKQYVYSAKEEIKKGLHGELRNLLRSSSKFINEKSDFNKLPAVLNQKMNEQVREYLEKSVMPKWSKSMEEWISLAESELKKSQNYLDDMCESFNALYGDDRMKLACDFKVLDDWRRDMVRLTASVHFEDENILNRFKTTQILLKGAGKLFSSVGQNPSFIANQYRKYIETESYDQAVESIIEKFFGQFELFEKGIERDVKMFFREPVHLLKQMVQEGEKQIQEDQERLNSFKENPEMYYDPLTVFQLKLRQCELLDENRLKPVQKGS